MEIGLHKNIPAAEYHALDYASNSRLSILSDVAARLKYTLDHPKEQTDEMMIGEAAHTLILQPHLFDSQFAVTTQCEGVTKKLERCTKGGTSRKEGKWYCSQHWTHCGAEPIKGLSPEQYARVVGMRDAVMKHPAASRLLAMAGDVEVSGIFKDLETSVMCKMRVDKLITPANGFSAAVDLKTTQDASPERIGRTLRDWQYDRQAAFYTHGLAALNAFVEHFLFIFVESKAPHIVTVGRIKDRAIERARAGIISDLLAYKQCVESGVWPDYSGEIIDIDLPDFEYRKELV